MIEDEHTSALRIENLNIEFPTRKGIVHAIRGLNLEIKKGETLALVGESGCGKSVTAHSINGLLPPPGRVASGKIFFEGKNLLEGDDKYMRSIRGNRISMIFQEPMTSLNPVFTIGEQLSDVIRAHRDISKKEARAKAAELLNLVKIPEAQRRLGDYPHQLSGGMRQRVMIAMALSSPEPGLMIADEPTTALDVTIQAQILSLLEDLKSRVGMSLLLITHDMGVVAEVADRVVVMYAGRKVEEGSVLGIFENPSHPYTVGLLTSLPSHPDYRNSARLHAIRGSVPDLLSVGRECPFSNRCDSAMDQCFDLFPGETVLDADHRTWCHSLEKKQVKEHIHAR